MDERRLNSLVGVLENYETNGLVPSDVQERVRIIGDLGMHYEQHNTPQIETILERIYMGDNNPDAVRVAGKFLGYSQGDVSKSLGVCGKREGLCSDGTETEIDERVDFGGCLKELVTIGGLGYLTYLLFMK
jgi:hypothetical protein